MAEACAVGSMAEEEPVRGISGARVPASSSLLHKIFVGAVKIGFVGTDARPVAAFRN